MKKRCLSLLLALALCLGLIPAAYAADAPAQGALTYTQIIAPQYEDAGRFSDNGLAAVKKNGKWGYIDTTGKVVIPFRYEMAFSFSEGLAVVFTEQLMDGYYNNGYRPAIIDEQGHETPIAVSTEDGCLYLDVNADGTVTPPRPDDFVFHNGYLKMQSSPMGDWLYDKTGHPLPCSGDLFLANQDMNEGLFPAYATGSGNWDVGWVDASGKTVKAFYRPYSDEAMPETYITRTDPFNQGLAPVWQVTSDPKTNESIARVGFMNRSFQWVIQPIYEAYNYYWDNTCYEVFGSTGLAMVKKDGKWGAINKEGKIVIPFLYEHLAIDSEGMIGYKLNGKFGYLDASTHNVAIAARYDNISMFKGGIAAVYDGSKTFLIDRRGNPIPGADQLDSSTYFNGTSISNPGTHVVIEKNGKYGYGLIEYTPSLPDAAEMDTWAYDAVIGAIQAGLVPVELQNLYKYNITRSEFCQLVINAVEEISGQDIWTLVQSKKGRSLGSYQQDLIFHDSNEYTVVAANVLGIVSGKGGGTFDPYADITRQEAAVLLLNAAKLLGLDTSAGSLTFADSDSVASWATDAVGFVSRTKIMGSTGSNRFSPRTGYTREQAFITIYRLYQLVG